MCLIAAVPPAFLNLFCTGGNFAVSDDKSERKFRSAYPSCVIHGLAELRAEAVLLSQKFACKSCHTNDNSFVWVDSCTKGTPLLRSLYRYCHTGCAREPSDGGGNTRKLELRVRTRYRCYQSLNNSHRTWSHPVGHW